MERRRGFKRPLQFVLGWAFLVANIARAEVGPKAVSFGAGVLNINTYTDAYLPTKSTTGATAAQLDVSLRGRWSLGLGTIMSTDESLIGYCFGAKLALGARKSEETGGTDGIIQYTMTHVPRWHFDLFIGMARYRFSQVLKSTNTSILSQLRTKTVKADLYGVNFTPSVLYALTERWGIQALYSYNYGVATGFNVVAHGLILGVNYAF
jgi:hypothetical protein